MANCVPSLINFAGGDGNKKVGVLVSSANRQTRPKNRGLRCDEKYASSLGLSLRPPTMFERANSTIDRSLRPVAGAEPLDPVLVIAALSVVAAAQPSGGDEHRWRVQPDHPATA